MHPKHSSVSSFFFSLSLGAAIKWPSFSVPVSRYCCLDPGRCRVAHRRSTLREERPLCARSLLPRIGLLGDDKKMQRTHGGSNGGVKSREKELLPEKGGLSLFGIESKRTKPIICICCFFHSFFFSQGKYTDGRLFRVCTHAFFSIGARSFGPSPSSARRERDNNKKGTLSPVVVAVSRSLIRFADRRQRLQIGPDTLRAHRAAPRSGRTWARRHSRWGSHSSQFRAHSRQPRV